MMNKAGLLKIIHNANRGNFFSTEIPKGSNADEKSIVDLAGELESEGKIKIRECIQREYSVFLHGIIKYAPK